jgi:hypothetical protein
MRLAVVNGDLVKIVESAFTQSRDENQMTLGPSNG